MSSSEDDFDRALIRGSAKRQKARKTPRKPMLPIPIGMKNVITPRV